MKNNRMGKKPGVIATGCMQVDANVLNIYPKRLITWIFSNLHLKMKQ